MVKLVTRNEDTDQPLRLRFNQKKAKYGHIARANGLSFIPAIFSHTGQIHEAIMGLMLNQIKMKMELIDPQVQNGKNQSVMRYWVRQLSAVINRTASRSIIERVNSAPPVTLSSENLSNVRIIWQLILKQPRISLIIWSYR